MLDGMKRLQVVSRQGCVYQASSTNDLYDKVIVISGTHCITHGHANMLNKVCSTYLLYKPSPPHTMSNAIIILYQIISKVKLNISPRTQMQQV